MAHRRGKGTRGRPPEPDAGYRQVAGRLRQMVRSGQWPAGSTLPSLRVLAKQHRVSQGQIRMAVEALRSEGWVATSLRRRLVAARPDRSATTTTNRTVLEVLSTELNLVLDSPWMAALQRGVERGAGEIGAPLMIAHGQQLRNALPDDLRGLSPMGIVLVGYFTAASFGAYERLNVPVVLVDRPDKEWKLHAASVDNVNAARQAAEKLIAMGHRRIAFLAFMSLGRRAFDPDSVERKQGFLDALKKAGIRSPRNCLFSIMSTEKASAASIHAILSASPPFTAVLAADENCATILMRAARQRGLSIPKDLSVACFQSVAPRFPEIAGPRTDFEDLGRQAMHLLLRPRMPAEHQRVPSVWCGGKTLAEV